MNKKLIITEEQLKTIKFYLLETEFDKMAENVIKNDDNIIITVAGKKYKFIVINSFSGQIYMDNIDKDTEYYGKRMYLTNNSFQNNNLELKVANDSQKNEKPLKGNTWKTSVYKNIEDISVERNGKIIDGTNYNPYDDQFKDKKESFINVLKELDNNKSLNLKTQKTELNLIFLEKIRNKFQFKFDSETEKKLNIDNVSSVEFDLDDKSITMEKDGSITINIVKFIKDENTGNITKKEDKIKNIIKWDVSNTKEEETKDKEEEGKEEKEDANLIKSDKALDMLNKHKDLRLLALNYGGKLKPSRLASFLAGAGIKEPKSAGMVAVSNLINTFVNDKITKKLGNNFLTKDDITGEGFITFEPLEYIEIPYTQKDEKKIFSLNLNEKYEGENSVKRNSFDDNNIDNDINLKLVKKDDFEIIVKDKTNTKDVFNCDVIKLFKETDEDKKEDVLKRSAPQKNVKIRFYNSDGYKSNNKKEKQ